MKVGGIPINGPKRTTLVLPRDEGDLVFQFVAVSDDSEFAKLYPPPEPPKTFLVAKQATVPDYTDADYQRRLELHNKARNAWIFLQSIAPSNIEWDTVVLTDPNTFDNWDTDMKRAGLSLNEVNQVWKAYLKSNIISDEMLDEARSRFLASLAPVASPTP